MLNFNNIQEYSLIPANTVVKARLCLLPGNDPENAYLTVSKNGESKYLKCDFVIMQGPWAKRKIRHLIAIEGNATWVDISKRFTKNLLESSAGISRYDHSEQAEKARCLDQLSDLDGLEVIIKIGIEPEGEFPARNKIASVVTADNPEYKQENIDEIPW